MNARRFQFMHLLAVLGTSAVMQVFAQPSPARDFLAADQTMACNSPSSCQAITASYYQTIGAVPNGARATLALWKELHGFGAPGGVEQSAVFYNRGDLAIGRDMHCRTYSPPIPSNSPLTPVTLACYVANFSDGEPGHAFGNSDPAKAIVRATQGQNPLATVVMETTYFKELSIGDPEVYFIVYDANGQPDPAPVLDGSKGGRNKQSVPGICLSCHGGIGGYNASNAPEPLSIRSNGTVNVVEGQFLPFDPSLYLFGDGTRRVATPNEQEDLRALNAMIRAIYASRPKNSHVIKDAIDGLYSWCGGVDKAGCSIDDKNHPFVPAGPCTADGRNERKTCGWTTGIPPYANMKPGFEITDFYTKVIAPYCRNCHLGAPQKFNVQNYASFSVANAARVRSVIGNHQMPFAEATFKNYFADTEATTLMSNYLDQVVVPGKTRRQRCREECAATKTRCDAEPNPNHRQCREEWRACYAACPN